ncbi:LamG-like jellyroll fold domain-containing protein [Flavimarina sp. Hel_I_48]|uniref:LamG-like jellyroll fold domain-containing protein n=1 Tax=Flavimarina sp. Hel_I_48 TaxID=1392488 RepID=UPI00068FB146|nr:LamG-like jellyroll fold domain-containing protein [Flavimarina sp. Hel_I_48]
MKKIYTLILLLSLCLLNLNAQTITLNGTDNKVSVPKNGSGVLNDFSAPHDFTIEVKFKFNSTPKGTIVSKHRSPSNGFFIEIQNGKIHSGMGSGLYTTITGEELVADVFYHAALSYEVATESFKLYVNGELVGSKEIAGTYKPNVNDNISMGSSDFWGEYNDLTLDYFRIWDVEKSAIEIAANKDIEVDCDNTELVLQYKFDNTQPLDNLDEVASCTGSNSGIFYGTKEVLGLPTVNKNIELHLFPNPATNSIQVSGLEKAAQYKIYNLLGRQVMNGSIVKNKEVDLQSLNKGIYFFSLDTGNTIKFMKNE